MNAQNEKSDKQANREDVAVIHGRFQALHNDHLKYLLAGKACCRHLTVGITKVRRLMGLVELIVNATVDIKEPFIEWEFR